MADSAPLPWIRILYSLVTAALLLVGLVTGWVALKMTFVGPQFAVAWGVPSAIFGIMGTLPVLFYLALKLRSRSWWFQIANRYCVNFYFPFLLYLGTTFLRLEKQQLVRELVSYNNKHVLRQFRGALSSDQVIVLVPHCLQIRDCDLRVTIDIEKCALCGRCDIRDLVHIGRRFGVRIFTATGGTLARRIVKETRPRAIVAVACERDLYSGLRDTFPLPVVGIFNRLEHGPCIDTRVSTQRIEQALAVLIEGADPTETQGVFT